MCALGHEWRCAMESRKQRQRRIKALAGKLPRELNGNQRRTLASALKTGEATVDAFSGVIHVVKGVGENV